MKPSTKAWKTRRAMSKFRSFPHKPANFVLWWSTIERCYYVSKRAGRKSDSENREHFIGFFANDKDAWVQAQIYARQDIKDIEKKIKYYEQKETIK